MVNYSVVPQVNPQNMDADPKYYARLQVSQTLTMMEFAEHISGHLGKYSAHEINAVLGMAVKCMREQMLEHSNGVSLGDLGSFRLSASSLGVPNPDQFVPSKIYKLKVLWTPGEEFDNLLEKAKFNLVPTREAQKEALKSNKTK